MEVEIKAANKLHSTLLASKKPPFEKEAVKKALNGGTFIDVIYPPIGSSVGSEETYSKSITWRRPQDFLDFDAGISSPGGTNRKSRKWQADMKLVEVFDEGVQASDINQGELGNCWFMCSLGALCEFPLLVDRLFVDTWSKDEETHENRSSAIGLYELRFCNNGEWTNVLVDDYFPCKVSTGTPIFSQCKGNEIWVLLVEKAYAKLKGSYYNCRLGDPGDGLLDLTGCPCVGYPLADPALTFDDVWAWDRNDCILCASTPGTDTFTEGGGGRGGGKTGLVPGHAYTVVQARMIRSGRYKGTQVLQMRNPWGEFEWTGAWSDNSREFIECRAELEDDGIDSNESAGDDGMFWMSWVDFKAHFISIDVCAPYTLQCGSTLGLPSTLRSIPPTTGLPPSCGRDPKRYVPPRTRRADHEREIAGELWYEQRVKSAFLAESVQPGARLRPRDCFLVEVPPLNQRKDKGVGKWGAIHAKSETVACLLTLSQVDIRRAGMAHGYVDCGLVMYKIGDKNGQSVPNLQEVGYVQPKAGRNVVLEAHLSEGTYALVPITGGVRPLPPDLDDPTLTRDPYKVRPNEGTPQCVHDALQQLCFLYDADQDGRLNVADLSRPNAAAFVENAKIDLSDASQPLARGKLIKMSEYGEYGLDPEHIEMVLMNAWGSNSKNWQGLFASVGYDPKKVRPTAGAEVPMVIAMHSSQKLNLRLAPLLRRLRI